MASIVYKKKINVAKLMKYFTVSSVNKITQS